MQIHYNKKCKYTNAQTAQDKQEQNKGKKCERWCLFRGLIKTLVNQNPLRFNGTYLRQ